MKTAILFTLIFCILLPASSAYAAEYTMESKHFIIDSSMVPYLGGNISTQAFNEWLSNMDKSYEAYAELYGAMPGDGAKITMQTTEQPGALWGGGTDIWWSTDWIDYYMQEIEQTGTWSWGPMHELGHCFDMGTWSFHAEFTANWPIFYAVDTIGAKSGNGDTLDALYDNFYKWTLDDQGEDRRYNDKLVCSFIDFVRDYGWEPFKKAFRSYNDGSYPYVWQKYVGSWGGVRLHDFVDRLSYFSGVDVSGEYILNRWPEALNEGYVKENGGYVVYDRLSAADYLSDIVAFGGHTYARSDKTALNWLEAQAFCESVGGHLVTVTSDAEQAFLTRLLAGTENESYWLGARQASSGDYEWVTGEKWSYSKWAPWQPSGGEQHYAVAQTEISDWMRDSGWRQYEWDDVTLSPGGQKIGFVCEWDNEGGSVVATPTRTTFMLDGAEAALPAYTINNDNYVKLRDVAKLLGDRFDVRWESDEARLYNHATYTSIGGELSPEPIGARKATPSVTDFVWGATGIAVTDLTAYNIGGNNYIKLRDIAKLFDFDVDWRDGKAWLEPDVSPYTDD
jgi:hypothetical protein